MRSVESVQKIVARMERKYGRFQFALGDSLPPLVELAAGLGYRDMAGLRALVAKIDKELSASCALMRVNIVGR